MAEATLSDAELVAKHGAEWKKTQLLLKEQLILEDRLGFALPSDPPSDLPPLKYVGGVDISFIKGNEVDACAALVVLSFPKLEV